MPPRFLYFDLGNVLLKFDPSIAFRRMAEVSGTTADRVRQVLVDEGLQNRFERGDLSDDAFYAAYCERIGARPDRAALEEAAADFFWLNTPIVPLIFGLRSARHRLGVFSNTCPVHWRYVCRRYALVREMFDVAALSYQLRAMKPDARAYAAAAEQAGVAPQEIFFTDDREENVAAARAAGFDAETFRDVAALADALRGRGLRFNY